MPGPRNKVRGSMAKAMENARMHAPEDAPSQVFRIVSLD